MFAQRIYNDYTWPNPIVLKLTHVQPAFRPPKVATGEIRWNAAGRTALLQGEIRDFGDASTLEAGFEYRSITGEDVMERSHAWIATPLLQRSAPGTYTQTLQNLAPGVYEVRATVKHPLLRFYGTEKRLVVK